MVVVLSFERQLMAPEVAVGQASHALLGRVANIEPGVYRGRMATLVTVEVDRWLRSPFALSPSKVQFLANDTRLEIQGTTYCNRGLRHESLTQGRPVLLATSNVLREEPLVLFPYDHELFYEAADSRVSLGAAERPDWSASWRKLLERLGTPEREPAR